MKISVITTIYKAEADLPRLLESMMAQQSPELEFFLIDNGSPDRCGEICKEYACRDNRFVICTLKDNIGYIRARNYGIENCTGDYIGFCDSDDYLEEGAYDRVVDIIHSTDCDLYITSYCTQRGNQKAICNMPFEPGLYEPGRIAFEILPSAFGPTSRRGMLGGFMWKQVFRRDIIIKNNIRFDESLKPLEDQIFNIDAISKCNRIYVDNNVIYNYVVSTTSITGQISSSVDYDSSWKRIEALYREKCLRTNDRGCIVASANAAMNAIYSLILQIVNTCNASPLYCARIFRNIVDVEVLMEIVKSANIYLSLQMCFVRTCLRLRLFVILFGVINGIHKLQGKNNK